MGRQALSLSWQAMPVFVKLMVVSGTVPAAHPAAVHTLCGLLYRIVHLNTLCTLKARCMVVWAQLGHCLMNMETRTI